MAKNIKTVLSELFDPNLSKTSMLRPYEKWTPISITIERIITILCLVHIYIKQATRRLLHWLITLSPLTEEKFLIRICLNWPSSTMWMELIISVTLIHADTSTPRAESETSVATTKCGIWIQHQSLLKSFWKPDQCDRRTSIHYQELRLIFEAVKFFDFQFVNK